MKLKSNSPIETLIDELSEKVPQIMAEAGIPGLSFALIRDAQLAWAKGFGVMDVNTQEPVTTEIFFEGASLSKPPFACAALMLHEQNLIGLDDPLSNYLSVPHVEDDSRLELITMRNVLCHMCGLPNWRPKDEPLKIRLSPGERFSYSGEGYMYLQKAIEEVTGQSGETFMQSTLFKPLGMTQSTYLWSEEYVEPIATGHNRESEPAKKFYPKSMWSAASLHTTPSDYARFLVAMMDPKANPTASLSSEITELMLTPQVSVNDSAPWHEDWPKETITIDESVSWGLGWGIQHSAQGDSFWHWGDNFTFRAFAVGYREEGVGVVIMTNNPTRYELFGRICQIAIGGEYPGIEWLRSL
ncbi:MAG: serine hydrolase domain-containing protein [Chloroflexota bacterium]